MNRIALRARHAQSIYHRSSSYSHQLRPLFSTPTRPLSSANDSKSLSLDFGDDTGDAAKLRPKLSIVEHPLPPPEDESLDPNRKFAIMELDGRQYKVATGDVLNVHKVRDTQVGTSFNVEDVLLVGSRNYTVIGHPTVPGAHVKCFVDEETKDIKVLSFKKRRRKNSQTMKGHRTEVTILRIQDVFYENEELK